MRKLERTRAAIALCLAPSAVMTALMGLGCSGTETPITPTPTVAPATPTVPPLTPTEVPVTPTLPVETPTQPLVTPTQTTAPSPSVTPSVTPSNTPSPTPLPMVAILQYSPAELSFGNVVVGNIGTLPLLLQNVGDAPLELDAEILDGADVYSFDAVPQSLEPEGSISVTVTFAPTGEGTFTGSLDLYTNDPDQPEVNIVLGGTGVVPTADDLDGDGSPSDIDCDDSDPNVFPGAPEVCDGKDNDCDGIDEDEELPVLYTDADADGHGDPASPFTPPSITCTVLSGYAITADDCNDANATVYSGASEVCDGVDNDCNNAIDEGVQVTVYADLDGDGHGDANASSQACAAGENTSLLSDDCDDANAQIYGNAPELCDSLDNDCDAVIDEELPQLVFYADKDLDGYGDGLDPVTACGELAGIVADDSDCDDARSDVFPGAVEACDGVDNDCDTSVDEDGTSTFYFDDDGDGYGDPSRSEETCAPESNQVSNANDCNDADQAINPAATEVCDTIDNDCDGSLDEDVTSTFYVDNDQDGFGSSQGTASGCTAPSGYVSNDVDCNDSDAGVNPSLSETCDLKDNNCNSQVDEGVTSTFYADADGDGHGNSGAPSQACAAGNGLVSSSDDCNDQDASVYPGKSEVCDLKDNDCDSQIDEGVKTTYYQDLDEDGYGNSAKPTQACSTPEGYVSNSTDCNDKNQDIYPGAAELCNSKDDDCDSQIDENVTAVVYKDADGDTYGDATQKLDTCSAPSGYVGRAGDCNDADATINPSASESCNAKDDDCDSQIDEGVKTNYYQDLDQDTYGNAAVSQQACSKPTGYVTNSTDCNDLNGTVYPGASERCDALDNDCDTQTDEGVGVTWYQDSDKDGYGNPSATTVACSQPTGYVSNSFDCNDSNASIYINATEVCNGFDDDCDNQIDENVKTTYYQDLDKDGYGNPAVTTQACTVPSGYVSNSTDCKDTNDSISPNATEIANGIDDDCDGSIDEGVLYATCKQIKQYVPTSGDGVYTIDLDGPSGALAPMSVYCDMLSDNGGWTLVLLNSPYPTPPKPTFSAMVSVVNITGTFGVDLTKFDLFMGLKFWNLLGSQMRLSMGSGPTNLMHKAFYNFTLDEGNKYALKMSAESVTVCTTGTCQPGMFTYHNNRPMTTLDQDNDDYGSNCASLYGNTAWWYGSCWSGSFWGGGDGGGYTNNPYWTSSGGEYFSWGAIWIR